MSSDLYLPQHKPSASNVTFPLEALKAAHAFLQAGIDLPHVFFVERKRSQHSQYQFVKSSKLLELNLPGNTTLKLWKLVQQNYDRTRYIPVACLNEDGFVWVGILDTSKLFLEGR